MSCFVTCVRPQGSKIDGMTEHVRCCINGMRKRLIIFNISRMCS
ncbi:hypothetical protein MANES_09G076433v8 [Manihot esculenta]|uniref:Uncharacterized protein n=1 Tax=Manihot esculenta TaxID=3983 RepID=A0ACB7H6A0_MANES|nr:hypothetical protein MANES_09G076433v8 [Manihot esculenta]